MTIYGAIGYLAFVIYLTTIVANPNDSMVADPGERSMLSKLQIAEICVYSIFVILAL